MSSLESLRCFVCFNLITSLYIFIIITIAIVIIIIIIIIINIDNRLHSDKSTVCISSYIVNTESVNVLFMVVKYFPWGKACKFNKPTLLCSFCLKVP